MSTTLKRKTPDEFDQIADDVRYELDDGKILERAMSNLSSWVGGYIYHLLTAHCMKTGLGRSQPDNVAYCCFPTDPKRVRKPDVSWFAANRWSSKFLESKYIEIAPDLIIEIVSPTDKAQYLNRKIKQFFEVGTKEAWIVFPKDGQVERRYVDGAGKWYKVDDEIDASPLIPGFQWKLADVLANA